MRSNHKLARSAYEQPNFRKAMLPRHGWTGLERAQAIDYEKNTVAVVTAFDRMQDTFVDHPTPAGRSVVIPDVPDNSRTFYGDLIEFLRRNGLKRVNSGWVREGYAVVFRTPRAAAQFRLAYPGRTLLPH